MFGSESWESEEHMSSASASAEQRSIDDIDFVQTGWRSKFKFAVAFLTSVFVFLFPLEWEGRTTIPLDVMIGLVQSVSMTAVELSSFLLILAGAVLTTLAKSHYSGVYTVNERTASRFQLSYWQTSSLFWVFRVAGVFLAAGILLGTGPGWLFSDSVVGTAWNALVLTIALVIPIGAIFVNLLAELGGLQFVGTLAQPIMRPLFNLPGRSALDSAASWLGSFSIGYYLTRNVFDRGGYNKREVFVICTCFATANLGTVGAVAAVLGVLNIFPVVVLLYLLASLIVASVLVRVPPLSRVPDEYIAKPDPEPKFAGTVSDYLRFAFNEGVRTAKNGQSITRASIVGFVDGAKLAASFVGTVLAIAMAVLLIEQNTGFFTFFATPFVPILDLLAIPDPQIATTAIIIGGAEYFVAATLVVDTDIITKVFVLVVTSSQAIFFSATAPMMVDMFDDIPIRFRDLFLLLVLRTVLLVPVAAVLTHAAAAIGLL